MHDLYHCVKDLYHPTRAKEKIYIRGSKYRARLIYISHRDAHYWVVQKFVLHHNIACETLYPEMIFYSLLNQTEFQDHFIITNVHNSHIPPFYIGDRS